VKRPDPLVSALLKLRRAEQHLKALDQSIEQWVTRDLIKVSTDRDRHGRVLIRLTKAPEVPPEWHARLGEFVHNLRSTLDHLAFQLNGAGSGDPPPNYGSSQFPIFERGPDYRSKSRKMTRCMPPRAVAALERMQPYHRRKDPDTRWLAVLRDLSNIDKHRRFPITATTFQGTWFSLSLAGHRATDHEIYYRPLRDNAIVASFEVPSLPPDVEPTVDFHYSLAVELERRGEPEPLALPGKRAPLIYVLRKTRDFVADRALPELAPFARPDVVAVRRFIWRRART